MKQLIGIRVRRKAKGLTQAELAKLSKVKRTNIAKYEVGDRNPPVMVLSRIAKALDTTIDDLISCDDDTEYHAKSPSSIGA